MDKLVSRTLREQAAYITELNRFITAQKKCPQNELLKKHLRNRRRALLRKGRRITNRMMGVYIVMELMADRG
jgi:hypothetical protein